MEEQLIYDVPCSSLAVESILRVGTSGALWGLCSGPYDARKQGLTGIARSLFVAKTVGKSSAQCGIFAGVFTTTRCGVRKYRGKNDGVNAIIAGALAGAAVAASSRSWRQVIEMAGLLSIFGGAADYLNVI